ncbi:WXG100 family type VII secretion target [Lentzea sp. JNUCC 0626]|uniref:WXG100 family type VII secretion target n=1 Tax=Lentzea sp. JNUCC 0626 TaxID=3367513 RepID=UPI0037482CB0
MAEQKTSAGGVEITVGEKTTGRKMAEAAPFYGNYLKTAEAAGKFSDGADGSEVIGLASEGAAVLGSLGTSVYGIATDPIGWLVGQGLNFLISVVQPLEDAIHFVSGDGPALQQAAENFSNIAKGVADMRAKFDADLQSAVQTWGGQASEVAGTKLGEFANGIDGVAGQAGELASMLQVSSMIMTIVEDFIKAILTELITWLVMIWIPALAAAVPSFGASTAAAGAATGVRVATTGSRVARIVARLRQFLDKIMAFLRGLVGRIKNVRTAFQKSMADKRSNVDLADLVKEVSKKDVERGFPGVPVPAVAKLWGSDGGMIGERVASGFPKAMGTAVFDAARGQLGVGTGTNAGIDKPLRNIGNYRKSTEYDDTGTDGQKQRIEGDLDL